MTDRELEAGLQSMFMGKQIHPALDDVPSVQSPPAGLRPVAGARVHMKGLAQALRPARLQRCRFPNSGDWATQELALRVQS